MIDVGKRLTKEELKRPIGHFTDAHEITFAIDESVSAVMHTLQSRKLSSETAFFYVTDHDNVLQGIVTVYNLLYSDPETKLSEIVEREILIVEEEWPLEKGLQVMLHNRLLSIPVVNSENQFVGILAIDTKHELTEHKKKPTKRHESEDIFQMIGFSIAGRWKSTFSEYRYRMPWLFCNLVGGVVCALIGAFFQQTLEAFVVLALFIPLVLTLSESISIQSMTLSLRFMHLKKIHWKQVWYRILDEWKTSVMLAFTCALCMALVYLTWEIDLHADFAISLSVLIAMIFSATFGALFPVLLHAFKLDPKVASGPLVLMMTDIATIAIYLTVGTVILIK